MIPDWLITVIGAVAVAYAAVWHVRKGLPPGPDHTYCTWWLRVYLLCLSYYAGQLVAVVRLGFSKGG